ncbi:MAG: hypothetical protein HQM15_00785 [Deltaproteobacteria bacterium]|nr:hypothetical protein [Deltaproteobacteria bacterium]
MISEVKLIENLLKESAKRLKNIKIALNASGLSASKTILPKRIRLRKKEEENEYQHLIEDLNEILAYYLGEELVVFRGAELLKGLNSLHYNYPELQGLKISDHLSLLSQVRAVVSNN